MRARNRMTTTLIACSTVTVLAVGVYPAVPASAAPTRSFVAPDRGALPNHARCTISGTSGDDVLVGTPRIDVICGFGGDDVIRGRGGDDVIYAGDGHDRVLGGGGSDRIFGGRGDDWLAGDRGFDEIEGGPGADELRGGPGADAIVGGDGDDAISGGRGHDDVEQGTPPLSGNSTITVRLTINYANQAGTKIRWTYLPSTGNCLMPASLGWTDTLGPSYQSKVLLFAIPEYGQLDSCNYQESYGTWNYQVTRPDGTSRGGNLYIHVTRTSVGDRVWAECAYENPGVDCRPGTDTDIGRSGSDLNPVIAVSMH